MTVDVVVLLSLFYRYFVRIMNDNNSVMLLKASKDGQSDPYHYVTHAVLKAKVKQSNVGRRSTWPL